jgi:restriction system protein
VFFLFLLICLVILLSFFKTPVGKGIWGEFIVNMMAKRFLDKEEYHLIKNVTLPTEAGTTQIDHIIVSQYGIFVVETKNMKGWIFGSKNQKDWTQKIYRSNTKFQNPLRQNYKHTKTLALLLDVDHSKLFSLIVFVGDSTFKTDMPDNVTQGMGYIRYIKSMTSPIFSGSDVQSFLKIIKGIRLTPNLKTHRDHVAHVKSLHAAKVGIKDQSQEVPVTECSNNFGKDTIAPTEHRGDLAQILISDLSRGSKSKSSSIGGTRTLGEKAMSEHNRPVLFKFKTALAVFIGIVSVVLATLYIQPIVIDFLHRNDVKGRISEIQPNDSETTESSPKVKKTKEYSFNDAQINKAISEVEKSRKTNIPSSNSTEDTSSLYEIEYVSGGRAYSEKVVATDDLVTFENEKGLVVSVSRSEVKNMKRLVQKGVANNPNYSCRGKTHCSQMNSCEEAKFYLRNCPGVKIDGDGNGLPCEKQWCGK